MTSYDPERDHRRSIRLRGYDYSRAGAYFITVCTQGRACLFGEIVDGTMILNDAGRVVEKCWTDISAHFPHVKLDGFVVMPNHVHGILLIAETVGANNYSPLHASPSLQQRPGASKTIGAVIRGFKIGVTTWMRKYALIHNIWQRNYYEHIIRNEDALQRIREYIATNPIRWAEDPENPKARAVGAIQKGTDDIDTVQVGANQIEVNRVGANNYSPLRLRRRQ